MIGKFFKKVGKKIIDKSPIGQYKSFKKSLKQDINLLQNNKKGFFKKQLNRFNPVNSFLKPIKFYESKKKYVERKTTGFEKFYENKISASYKGFLRKLFGIKQIKQDIDLAKKDAVLYNNFINSLLSIKSLAELNNDNTTINKINKILNKVDKIGEQKTVELLLKINNIDELLFFQIMSSDYDTFKYGVSNDLLKGFDLI